MSENQETKTNEAFLLEMLDIDKTFPGVKALDDVNLSVRKGTIHAICGENGAGRLLRETLCSEHGRGILPVPERFLQRSDRTIKPKTNKLPV